MRYVGIEREKYKVNFYYRKCYTKKGHSLHLNDNMQICFTISDKVFFFQDLI